MSSELAELARPVDDLPKGWLASTVAEVADILDNKRVPLNSEERGVRSGPYPYWGANGIVDYIDDYIFDEPLVLMAEDGGYFDQASTRPICHKLDGRAWVNNHAHIIRPTGADRDYFYYWFVHRDITPFIKGGTRSKLNQAELKRLPIWLPPLDEQRRIAEVLRSVDEAIALSKETVEQAENTSRGLLQRLFVEGIGHHDFKEGCSSSIPISWREMSLNELSAIPITYGVVQPGPKVPDGVAFVRGGDFPNGKIDLGALRTISAEVAGQYRRTQLKGGEIVISLVGYPGACAVVPEALAGANIARQAALVRPKPEVMTSYLYQFLRSPIGQGRLKKETIGSAQQVINLRDLKEVIIAVPPLQEQEKIAAILGDLDRFVELERVNLAKLNALKISISADLLAARVRVPA